MFAALLHAQHRSPKPAASYRQAWREWSAQFSQGFGSLQSFCYIRKYVHEYYADEGTKSQEDFGAASGFAAYEQRQAHRQAIRDAVVYTNPGVTTVFLIPPASWAVLEQVPPPTVPAHDWEATTALGNETKAAHRHAVDKRGTILLLGKKVKVRWPRTTPVSLDHTR